MIEIALFHMKHPYILSFYEDERGEGEDKININGRTILTNKSSLTNYFQ
jgi:hypothetical protein